jgi:hypothetical protein
LVYGTRQSCGADLGLWQLHLVLSVCVDGLVVLLLLLLFVFDGRRSLSIAVAVLRLHMRNDAVHVRRRREGLLRADSDLGRAGRRLNVEVKVVMMTAGL